jgi:hypothetical protein
MSTEILQPKDWRRAGRGEEKQFFATDDEIQGWLSIALPAEYAPYFLISSEQRDPLVELHKAAWLGVDEFLRLRHSGRTRFWLASELLSGHMRDAPPVEWPLDAICAVNGLIFLQHGSVFQGKIDASRVSITKEVQNVDTGEVLKHRTYHNIFRQLIANIASELIYSTRTTSPNGEQREDTYVLMTEGAKRSFDEGVELANAPGRPISQEATGDR